MHRHRYRIAAALGARFFVLPFVLVAAAALHAAATHAQTPALPLIVTATQAQQLIAAGAKVIDLRADKDYRAGHIPGAVSLPWRKLNLAEVDGIRNEFAADAVIEKAIADAGLSYDDRILIYENSALPGRAFVILTYAGLGERIHVLDGGIGAWTGKLSTEATPVTPSAFKLTRKNDVRVDQRYVASKIGAADAVIVDGRDAPAYEDGHIPGARGLPAASLLTPQRTLKPAAELQRLLADAGVSADRQVVAYCGSGVYAANNYLALRNLGYKNVVFYDPSWDEWSRDPDARQEISLANYTIDGAELGAGQPAAGPRFLDRGQLQAALDDGKGTVVLDVRSPADYDWGHIPGSVNVFWNDSFDANRKLLPLAQLQARYAQAGLSPGKRVVIYARGGYQLTHSYTVLSLLGYRNVDFYTGKFEGWKSK